MPYRDPAFLAVLRCPRCQATGAFEGARALTCGGCGLEVAVGKGGFIDLLDVTSVGEPPAAPAQQRFMESELLARL